MEFARSGVEAPRSKPHSLTSPFVITSRRESHVFARSALRCDVHFSWSEAKERDAAAAHVRSVNDHVTPDDRALWRAARDELLSWHSKKNVVAGVAGGRLDDDGAILKNQATTSNPLILVKKND